MKKINHCTANSIIIYTTLVNIEISNSNSVYNLYKTRETILRNTKKKTFIGLIAYWLHQTDC